MPADTVLLAEPVKFVTRLAGDLHDMALPPEVGSLGRALQRRKDHIADWHRGKATKRPPRRGTTPSSAKSGWRSGSDGSSPQGPGIALRRQTQLGPTSRPHSRCNPKCRFTEGLHQPFTLQHIGDESPRCTLLIISRKMDRCHHEPSFPFLGPRRPRWVPSDSCKPLQLIDLTIPGERLRSPEGNLIRGNLRVGEPSVRRSRTTTP